MIEALKEQHNPKFKKLKKMLIRENTDLKSKSIKFGKLLEKKEKFTLKSQTK